MHPPAHRGHTEAPFRAQAATFPLHGKGLPLRMMLQNVLHPLLGTDMGVDFGGKDAFVA